MFLNQKSFQEFIAWNDEYLSLVSLPNFYIPGINKETIANKTWKYGGEYCVWSSFLPRLREEVGVIGILSRRIYIYVIIFQ